MIWRLFHWRQWQADKQAIARRLQWEDFEPCDFAKCNSDDKDCKECLL